MSLKNSWTSPSLAEIRLCGSYINISYQEKINFEHNFFLNNASNKTTTRFIPLKVSVLQVDLIIVEQMFLSLVFPILENTSCIQAVLKHLAKHLHQEFQGFEKF